MLLIKYGVKDWDILYWQVAVMLPLEAVPMASQVDWSTKCPSLLEPKLDSSLR